LQTTIDILITIVYLAQDQFETFVEQIKASDLPKPTQWDLIDLLNSTLANYAAKAN
jgi:hypothetical protein